MIGEGGSGGAIAIALADRVLMQENAIYSVISPEGCAAILWRDAGEARKAAAAFKPDAAHCLELGVIDAIVPEPTAGPRTTGTRPRDCSRDSLQRRARGARRESGSDLVAPSARQVSAEMACFRANHPLFAGTFHSLHRLFPGSEARPISPFENLVKPGRTVRRRSGAGRRSVVARSRELADYRR